MHNLHRDIMTIEEVAEKLYVTRGSIYKMVRDGALAEPMRTLSGVIIGWDRDKISNSISDSVSDEKSEADSAFKDDKTSLRLSAAAKLMDVSHGTAMQWLNKLRTGRSCYTSVRGQKMTISQLKAILKQKGAKRSHLGADGCIPAVVRPGKLKVVAGFDDRDIGIMVAKGVLPEPMRMGSSEVYGWTDLCVKECLGIEIFDENSKWWDGGPFDKSHTRKKESHEYLAEKLPKLSPIFTRNELGQKDWKGLTYASQRDEAIKALLKKGMIRTVNFKNGGTRDTIEFIVHPDYRK